MGHRGDGESAAPVLGATTVSGCQNLTVTTVLVPSPAAGADRRPPLSLTKGPPRYDGQAPRARNRADWRTLRARGPCAGARRRLLSANKGSRQVKGPRPASLDQRRARWPAGSARICLRTRALVQSKKPERTRVRPITVVGHVAPCAEWSPATRTTARRMAIMVVTAKLGGLAIASIVALRSELSFQALSRDEPAQVRARQLVP